MAASGILGSARGAVAAPVGFARAQPESLPTTGGLRTLSDIVPGIVPSPTGVWASRGELGATAGVIRSPS